MSIINIGLSGLTANSAALNVTALNTANANTVGYTRQVVDMESVSGGQISGYGIGAGVDVQAIRRVFDSSANSNLRSANTEYGYNSTMYDALSYLEEILGADGLEVNDGLDDFFSAVNAANTNPSDSALRLQVIQKAELLVQSINQAQTKVIDAANTQIELHDSQLDEVNNTLSVISQLNTEIKKMSTASEASSLLDSMDVALNSLAGMVDINTIVNDDGTVEVSLASGEPLVNGNKSAVLSRDDSAGQYSTRLNLTFVSSTYNLKGNVGGAVGASSDVVTDEILPLMDVYNDIAQNFADQVNAVLATGFDLQGNAGQALLDYNASSPATTLVVNDLSVDELAFSSDGNTGDGGVLHDLADIASMQFTISGSTNVTLNDGYVVAMGNLGSSTAKSITLNDIATSRLNAAQSARDSISAVSSDEEAANLMLYMNAYNANLKVVAAGNSMFESVLAAL